VSNSLADHAILRLQDNNLADQGSQNCFQQKNDNSGPRLNPVSPPRLGLNSPTAEPFLSPQFKQATRRSSVSETCESFADEAQFCLAPMQCCLTPMRYNDADIGSTNAALSAPRLTSHTHRNHAARWISQQPADLRPIHWPKITFGASDPQPLTATIIRPNAPQATVNKYRRRVTCINKTPPLGAERRGGAVIG